MLQKYREAIQDYTKALASKPDNGDIYYNRAFSYQRLNEVDKACADWLKAMQLEHPAAADMLKQYCEHQK
ncbi:Tetratricopeptide repeat protein [anaerobic digester metagenome]